MEMERNERVESGEKLFVIGMVVSFVTEVAYTTSSVLDGAWAGFFLGLVGSLLVLRLANWSYTGNSSALKWMLSWTGLQLLLAIIALWALLSTLSGPKDIAHTFGYGMYWAWIKLIAYAILGAVLMSPSVRAFLFLKAGGDLAEIKEKTPPTLTGKTLPLNPAESQSVANLAGLLWWAGVVLFVVGALRAILGWKLYLAASVSNESGWIHAGPALAEGFVMLVVGVLLFFGPSSAFDFLRSKSTDTTHLMSALEQLSSFYMVQCILLALVVVVLAAVIAARLLM